VCRPGLVPGAKKWLVVIRHTRRVANLFCVQTEFFHVYYLPLVPLRTYLVIANANNGSDVQRVPLSMCGKSVLIAWARTAVVLALLVSTIAGIICFFEQPFSKTALLWTAVFFGSMVAYWLSCRFTVASYERAVELGERLGIARSVIAEMYLAFPNPEFEAPDNSFAQPRDRSDDAST
jgi:hypothetical protein